MRSRLRRLVALSVLLAATLAAAPDASAQQPGKVPTVGFLAYPAVRPGWSLPLVTWTEIRQSLRDLGYHEGQNIVVQGTATNTVDLLPDLVADLVRLDVAAIVATGVEAARAARAATRTIPIVIVSPADPVETGLVASLARPGDNVTGISLLTAELGAKRLELLRESVPRASRVAVLWNPADAGAAREWGQVRAAASRLGVTVVSAECRTPEEIEGAFVTARKQRAGALVVVWDPLTYARGTRIVELAAKNRLPAMYGARAFVERGGLLAYQPSTREAGRRVAALVDKILKGARPGDLPVEEPAEFDLVVNMKTARALGLQIPESVLVRAEQVFQ
jgi:putative ABC transport system substrate-binding protein